MPSATVHIRIRRAASPTVGRDNLVNIAESLIDPLVFFLVLWGVAIYPDGELTPPCLVLSVIMFSLPFPAPSRLALMLWRMIRNILAGWIIMADLLVFFGYWCSRCLCPPRPPGDVSASPWDKLVHFGFFGCVTFLLAICFGGSRVHLAFIAAVLTGAADESYQAFLPTRHADWCDLLTDVVAAACAALLARHFLARASPRAPVPGSPNPELE